MAIKVELSETPSPSMRQYPYIGENNVTGVVVLFSGPNTGVVLRSVEGLDVGHYSDDWDELGCFTSLVGTITLSNA